MPGEGTEETGGGSGFPPENVYVGRKGEIRPIEFRKIEMDSEFVWKFGFVGKGRLKTVSMAYYASLVRDPTEFDEELSRCAKAMKSPQQQIGREAEILAKMKNVHHEYSKERYEPVDFLAAVVKLENKPFSQQAIQLRVSTEAAVKISELGEALEKSAIVLVPMSEEEFRTASEREKRGEKYEP